MQANHLFQTNCCASCRPTRNEQPDALPTSRLDATTASPSIRRATAYSLAADPARNNHRSCPISFMTTSTKTPAKSHPAMIAGAYEIGGAGNGTTDLYATQRIA